MTRLTYAFVKRWHPHRKRLARLRALYWIVVRRYEYEICQVCGAPVSIVYHAPDRIWEQATGWGPRDPSGESAPGILCPGCLDDLAEREGLPYLRWTCDTEDWPMVFQVSPDAEEQT